MRAALLISTLALLGFAVSAQAQEAQCFQNEQFLVIAQERTDDVGTDFLVRAPAKGKIKCEFVEAEGDFSIGNPDDPLWYAGLAGKYLALTRSTGPDGDVVIYDLDSRSKVVDVAADDDLAVDEDRVVYWERVAEGTDKTCPEFAEYQANGLGAVIAEERVFDATTGEIAKTGESRCSATQ